VVGCGVRASVAWAQHPRQRLAGVVTEQQQRMISERVPVD
jgi:hypothetical protein